MLKYFSVENFKCFKDKFVFDLSKTNNYEFNTNAVENGIVSKSIIYGWNGCGKSNLGLAIFDLVLHLTDKEKLFKNYQYYLNFESDKKYAAFCYIFEFDGKEIVYNYSKYDIQQLRSEELIIDGTQVLSYDFDKNEGKCALDGTQNLKLSSPDSKLSKLKFIRNNSILVDNDINSLFYKMMDFVDNMLLFYCLMERGYQGFQLGIELLGDAIVKSGKLRDFEGFLHQAGIKENLEYHNNNGVMELYFKYKKGIIPFENAASAGTKSLELFYYWLLRISKSSFVFIDEFDAFYHYELSELIVKELYKLQGVQIILTTHNTDLLSNDLLRPDCYFSMTKRSISSFSNMTRKELREAHNIQKMYKAGMFNGE